MTAMRQWMSVVSVWACFFSVGLGSEAQPGNLSSSPMGIPSSASGQERAELEREVRGMPDSLEKAIEEADVAIKATAVSNSPIENPTGWFARYPQLQASSTEMNVISVIKGELDSSQIIFQHYEPPPYLAGRMPEAFSLVPGRSYIVLARKTEDDGALRQVERWAANAPCLTDPVVVLTADDRPVQPDLSLSEAIWEELTRLLKNPEVSDVVYAIRQFDPAATPYRLPARVSFHGFPRDDILAIVSPFVHRPEEEIAVTAIEVIGAYSPFIYTHLLEDSTSLPRPGKAKPSEEDLTEFNNADSQRFSGQLLTLADEGATPRIRAKAIRALGGVNDERIPARLDAWASDSAMPVRRAAAMLCVGRPGSLSVGILEKLATDSEWRVRASVACAIRYGRFYELTPLLARMLDDGNARGRASALINLVALPRRLSGEILKANVDHPHLGPVIVVVLAEENPEPYLDSLAENMEGHVCEEVPIVGTRCAPRAWDTLFRHARSQSTPTLESQPFSRYLDALEGEAFSSSSPPRDLYALYIQRGMKERAQAFREKCKTTVSFDMGVFFDQVDQQPNGYLTE